MKKKSNHAIFRVGIRKWSKIVLANFILMLLSCAVVYAQNDSSRQQKISAKYRNNTILEVLEDLKAKTGYTFVHKQNDISDEIKITETFTNATLDEVLKKVLVAHGYDYSIEGKVIVVKKKAKEEQAQEVKLLKVSGRIVDEKGEPLPGVTVKLKGTNVGTATNVQGNFSLALPIGTGSLEFSYVGYKLQKVNFVEGRKDSLLVVMEEDIQVLDETVVVAYGNTTKREMTGAVSVIKAEELKGIPSPSIANLLQGRVAGMDITNMSGAPGSGGTAITIRGYNSLDIEQGRRFSNPLWVVDGVPLNSFTSPVTGTNLLADINPDMIESIQVLKDASSAAIYGSRAANGVIIVTTKKGRKEQNATFSVNASQTWSILPKLPSITIGRAERLLRLEMEKKTYSAYMDEETQFYVYPKSLEEIYHNGGQGSLDANWTPFTTSQGGGSYLQDSLNPFYNNATNFFPMYYVTGKVTNANLQTYGGSERMSYGIGLGYYDEAGIMKGTGFNRMDLNVNLNVFPVKRLNVDVRFNASLSNRKRGVKYSQLNASPSIETVPGDPMELSTLYPGKGTIVWDNILDALSGTKEKNRSVRLRSNFKVGYDIIDGLNFSTLLAADYSINRRNYFSPSYLDANNYSISVGETGINLMVLNENLLSFKKIIHETHSINGVVGMSYQYDQVEYNGGSAQNSPSDKIYYAPSGLPILGEQTYGNTTKPIAFQRYCSDMEEKVLISYFLRGEYNYMKKYLLSASIRWDGSSTFGRDHKWGMFPSIAGAWTFSEEFFIKDNLSWLNYGKIRMSWGRSGMHFSNPYLALGVIVTGNVYEGNGTLHPEYNEGLYNDELGWEETDQYDFGLDLDFFNYRLGVVFDYYYRYTDKLLDKVGLPSYGGYSSQWRNAAAISNEGIELLVKYDILRKDDLYWKVSVNAAKNWNRFGKSYNGKDRDWSTILGKSLNGIYVTLTDGYINSQDEVPIVYNAAGVGSYMASGSLSGFLRPGDYKYIDVDGNGSIGSEDLVYVGSALPKVSGGIVSEFRWKNFDMNLSLAYQLGRHILNPNQVYSLAKGPIRGNLSKITFWEKPGDDHADFAMLQGGNRANLYQGRLDRYVEKVNWLKLKTLTVGYNLPKTLSSKSGMSEFRIFVSGENLFTWTNYSGLDPETVNISTGEDKGDNYPLARKYTIGLTVKF